MSGDGRCELPAEFLDLVDEYCSGVIDEAGAARLEHYLLGSGEARRHFAEYFLHHTEIHFAIRADRAVGAVLERLAAEGLESDRDAAPKRARRLWLSPGRWLGLAAAIAAAAVAMAWIGPGLRPVGQGVPSTAASGGGADHLAWLVNAQDCRWEDDGQGPGRDMRAGKELRLVSGLAEIEFDCGARVILQGPAGVRLLSGRSAQLLNGTLTARVPGRARGFTVFTPHNRVVDLGTEFGVSVDAAGAASVRVFTGEVVAYPLASERSVGGGITLRRDEGARLDGRRLDRDAREPQEAVNYVRAIEPPPIITPRTLRLDFDSPMPGTILDADGRGIGLTRRLLGTGAALPDRDPNLRLRTDDRALELTTTRSDLNTQSRIRKGEYLGVRLRDLGFTGVEDFEIRATIPSIPGMKVVGQFGLYAGSRSDRNIRGGLISLPRPDTYRLFLVNNSDGFDSDIYEVGLMNSGDDLRLTLRRIGGRYSLVVDDLRRRSSSTLTIAHPAFLDGETDLDVGIFGANPLSDQAKTLTVHELGVTVWTPQAPGRTIGRPEPTRPIGAATGARR